MKKKWNTIVELDFHNRLFRIFEKYRIDDSLFPELAGKENYYITHKEVLPDLINELIELARKEHPLWNFGRFPDEETEYGKAG